MQAALQIDLKDGFQFLKVAKSEMERDTPYGGSRFEIAWEFQKKPQSDPLRIDLCAGDDVDPERSSCRKSGYSASRFVMKPISFIAKRLLHRVMAAFILPVVENRKHNFK